MLVDRFFDGAPDRARVDDSDPQAWHGGDLAGVRARLDHISSLGFSRIWLSPIFTTRHAKFRGHGAFHGYWTADLRGIDPRFGSEDELRALGNDLVARHMGMMLDVVTNHVGYGAPLVADHPDWFHHTGTITDWNDPEQLESNEVHGLPDLDQDQPEVWRYLVEGTSRWLGLPGLVGLRLDAVKHVPARFWSRFDAELHHRAPNLELLGELYDGAPERLARAMRDQGFDELFDFPVYFALVDTFCKGQSPMALAAILSLDRLYPDANRLVTFADNHDLPRLWSLCRDRDHVHALLRFQLAIRGIPMLTYGTEVGLTGMGEPDNRADMRFPALPTPTMMLVRELLAARAAHPALARGTTRVVIARPDALVLRRDAGGETAFVAYAAGSAELSFPVAGTPSQVLGPVSLATGVAHIPAGRVGVVVTRGAGTPAALPPVTVEWTLTGSVPAGARLVGAGPELGGWDPATAPSFDGGHLALRIPAGTTLVYKLVAVPPGGAPRWEGGDNRFLHVGGEGRRVEIQWHE